MNTVQSQHAERTLRVTTAGIGARLGLPNSLARAIGEERPSFDPQVGSDDTSARSRTAEVLLPCL